eukprot:PITA_07650
MGRHGTRPGEHPRTPHSIHTNDTTILGHDECSGLSHDSQQRTISKQRTGGTGGNQNEGTQQSRSPQRDSNNSDSNIPKQPGTNEQLSQPLQQHLRRSTRVRRFPSKYDDFETGSSSKDDVTSSSGNVSHDCGFNQSTISEPNYFEEATNCDEWKDAMKKEYDALIKNGTWMLVDPPAGVKPIGCKWVYKIKYKADGSLDKYKARLIAKGYAQKEGVDYTETFSPTTKWGTIRTLFSLATQNIWKIHHMDVKTTFLNSDLKENVYMF